MSDTVDLKCPKCGRFISEVGTFGRGKCCGYQITIEYVRPEKPPERLTASKALA